MDGSRCLPRFTRRLAVVGFGLLLAAACGALPPGLPKRVVSPDELTPLARPAETYGTPKDPASPEDGPIDAAFLAGLPPGYRALMAHASPIDAVAEVAATVMSDRGVTLAPVVLEALLRRAGEVGNFHHQHAAWARGGDEVARLKKFTTASSRGIRLRRVSYAYGSALQSEGVSRRSVATLVVERPVTLEPLPRHVAVGAPIVVRGKFEVAVKAPVVHFSLDDLRTWSAPIVTDADGRFELHVPAAEKAGVRSLEISSQRAREDPTEVSEWRNALLQVPLYVDTPEPPPLSAELMNPAADPPDTAEMAARMLASYNAERIRVERAPLTLDAGLSGLAGVRMEENRAAPQAGSPNDLLQRVRATGCAADRVHEYVGRRGRNVRLADIVRDHLESPRIRSELLSEETDRIGVHFERTEEGALVFHLLVTRRKGAAL